MSTTRVEIDDYYPHDIKPRYGGSNPVHPELEAILKKGLASYEKTVQSFVPYLDQLKKIPFDMDPESPQMPYWNNGFIPGLDGVALYCLAAELKPKLYIEVGSGNSTRFLYHSLKANQVDTRIVSIDPFPRAEIDELCDTVIRKPLEECDISLFDQLEPGDFLFFDGSHRVLQNSDNTVFFLEVLPRIKPGVIVHIHDIMLPADYPIEWKQRWYSEQYVLAAMLLFAEERFEVILPNAYVSWLTRLPDLLTPLWETPGLEEIHRHGGSFWFTLAGRN